jgi:hypothetical protein
VIDGTWLISYASSIDWFWKSTAAYISIRFNGNGTRSVLHTCKIEDTTF